MADKIVHGTAQQGERNGVAKLTDIKVQMIRAQTHRSETDLAEEFGVDRSNIGYIRNRKTWKHI